MAFARENKAFNANIYRNRLFGDGGFKKVYAGVYADGLRKGQDCVAKEFKSGTVVEDHYFAEELRICAKAQQIIDKFNEQGIMHQEIRLNAPEIWTYAAGRKTGHKALVEPMILNFEKFNSNTGWVLEDITGWSAALQSLSHFSYHITGGKYLLCDLQGGRYNDGFILTDPVIMSRAGDRGPADLGKEGMRLFFQEHQCTPFCEKSWLKPSGICKAKIPRRRGTTMFAYLPDGRSRLPLSKESQPRDPKELCRECGDRKKKS
ncbi:hypothetical protein TWF281_000225 [Arthrobotrys megalospora]